MFKLFMKRARAEYQLIVIDTNPSATFVTMQVLEESNFLVAPITQDIFSMRGIELVTENLRRPYDWLSNPDRISIFANKVPRPHSEADIRRLERDEQELRNRFPRLGRRMKLEKIYQSAFLANKTEERGYIADQIPMAMNREQHGLVISELGSAAAALQMDLTNAFGKTQKPETVEGTSPGIFSRIFS